MRYAIVMERAENNYAAYVPDLPGCIATGQTVEETEQLIREAIEACTDQNKTIAQARDYEVPLWYEETRVGPSGPDDRRRRFGYAGRH